MCVVRCDDGLLRWRSYGCLTLVLPHCDPLLRLPATGMQKLCQSSFSLQPNEAALASCSQNHSQMSLSTLFLYFFILLTSWQRDKAFLCVCMCRSYKPQKFKFPVNMLQEKTQLICKIWNILSRN